ncbi:hypothetical protein, variant 1 [Verruconis gallopava]|uniref:Autophagy-related protein 17 n=1 Tax=Verruconis gallopava TaxID=253628 RepID=A0A0D1YVL6_9PEZI|nr:hypothetical protein, variant 1 [Verruconis gallopava]KIW04747.1 hypothetical protein, variant 1 [Verruconis gallopava]
MASTPLAPQSPSSSQGSFHEPNLEQLVEYLLASKRSLSSISLVWRAREIVESGRASLVENAALCARNAYVRRVLERQVECLEAIGYGATEIDTEGFEAFQATVQSLDAASSRLQKTLASLRSTPVEAALRPADNATKHLFDFVDEGGIHDLERSIKASIDRFEAARSTLAQTCEAFEEELERLHEIVLGENKDNVPTVVEKIDTPIPALFHQLESRATEVAGHLESLTRHYDLCVTALKHTEGGGEAITRNSTGEEQQTSALVGLGVDLGKVEDAPAQPISEEERKELLTVLCKDADEVEDVVADIRDILAEMEDNLYQITTYVESLRSLSSRLRDAMAFLKDIIGKLPVYISACAEFQRSWDEEKEFLHEKLDELEGLTDFYDGFEAAYDELLLEVERRRQVKRDMEKVIRAAMEELEALYQDDLHHRDSFRENQAEYIPSDLWPGLMNPPTRFKILPVDDAEDDVPNIKKSIIERAMKRVKERAKPFKRHA